MYRANFRNEIGIIQELQSTMCNRDEVPCKKYYEDKMIEKYKYDKLLEEDAIALYFVADPKGNYLYWLNDLPKPKLV